MHTRSPNPSWQVRDMLTTSHEQQLLRSGQATSPSLKRDAVLVDAVVNTIGFPLVGGPAGGRAGWLGGRAGGFLQTRWWAGGVGE